VRPFASSSVISTTRKCSARVRVGLSPVVPQGTRKLMPASICRRTRRRSVVSSNARSRVNGVTKAVPHPVNMYHLLVEGRGPGVGGRGPGLLYYFPKFVKALLAYYPTRRLECAAGKSLAAAGRVSQRNCISGGIETDLVCTGMSPGAVGIGVDGARVSNLL